MLSKVFSGRWAVALATLVVAALVPFRSSATPVLAARVKSLARFSV